MSCGICLLVDNNLSIPKKKKKKKKKTILSIAYRKAKVKLQKKEERDRRTHFLQIQRGHKSQYTKENTVGDILS